MNKIDAINMLRILGILMIIMSIILLNTNSDYYDSITACLVFLVGGIGMFAKSFFIDE